MIIKSLKIKDFRQFYGDNKIEFGTDKKNVTLILGANGNGKTGIFRAVMFAFYGDEILDQDENTGEIHLVNLDKLNENVGLPVTATVEMEFENENIDYLIRRSITSIKDGIKIQNHLMPAELFEYGEHGDFSRLSENIDSFVNHILEKDIREFFFFDAEKMQLLNSTKSSRSMSKEIKNGIIRLLQIKSLDEGTSILQEMINSKNKDIASKAKDGELQNKVNEKEQIEKDLAVEEESLDNLRLEKKYARNELEEIEKKLSSSEEIRNLQTERNKENEIIDLKRKNYSQSKKAIRYLFSSATSYLAQDLLERNETTLLEFQNKKTDQIPLELIDQSLFNHKCAVCQTNIEKHSIQHLVLEKLKEEYSYSNTTPIVNNILRVIDGQRKSKGRFIEQLNGSITEVVNAEEAIEQSEIILRKLDNIISDRAANLENLKLLEEKLSTLRSKVENFNFDIPKKELHIEELKAKLIKAEREIAELSKKFENVRQESLIRNKFVIMKQILESVTKNYTEDVITDLSIEMTTTLSKLLDAKDRNIFDRVVIDPNFDIKLLDRMGINRVQDLSMGQGQIFTLSFILSLAKLASRGRSEINFPLFMDTPFGRLSGVNRDNLIKNVPELTNQWILLLTDTELTRVERDAFDQYERVGKVYELENFNGKTKIAEKNTVNNLVVRG